VSLLKKDFNERLLIIKDEIIKEYEDDPTLSIETQNKLLDSIIVLSEYCKPE